jgi:hypothetical protein
MTALGRFTMPLAVSEQQATPMSTEILSRLLESDEPSIRYTVRSRVLGADPASPEMVALREEIRTSPRVAALLAERDAAGRIPGGAYAKWTGAHWVLSTLAELHYPPGDAGLNPLREQVLGWLLSPVHTRSVKAVQGRYRRCASQEGNALWAMLALGIADERADELAARLIRWAWPDGGWNCDKNPAADTSSFMESLIPLRALALHARVTGSEASRAAAERAAEVFLTRRLFRRIRDGAVINKDFVLLHYPCYWHYDVLFGLVVMAGAGLLRDPRCAPALERLESMRLPDGGFPAGAKYWTVTDRRTSGRSRVAWGPVSATRMNPWVTADALAVLRVAS